MLIKRSQTDENGDDDDEDLWAITDDQLKIAEAIKDAIETKREEADSADGELMAQWARLAGSDADGPRIGPSGSDTGGIGVSPSGSGNGDQDVEFDSYRDAIGKFRNYSAQYDCVLGQIRGALDAVNSLMTTYDEVSNRTSSLHEACEQLMSDQTQLAASAEDIRNRLTYFTDVETLIHKLSSPLLKVTSESFTHILNNIDGALSFLAQHRDYKESELYSAKYQQCLSRALTLVRTHVRALLKLAEETVSEKCKANKDPAAGLHNDEDLFTLYYGVFGAQAAGLKTLMENLESRVGRNPEYESAMVDCYQAYYDARLALMLPSVNVTVQGLGTKFSKNPCTLVRTACTFLLRVAEDESTLYNRFFGSANDQLVDFLEKMCSSLYDVARPVVVKSAHLEALAELCSILQHEMLDESYELERSASSGFVRVVDQLLGDVRERLVYRAQLYARSDIAGYNPAPGDLAYPEKLEMMQAIADSQAAQEQEEQTAATIANNATGVGPESIQSVGGRARLSSIGSTTSAEVASIVGAHVRISPADMHGLWYPPVRRTIMWLSKLYRSLDFDVFQGLCQEITAVCIESLQNAMETLLKNGKNPLDARLFYLKHLLILREQTACFRVGQSSSASIKETTLDFDKIRSKATNLLTSERRRLFSLSNNGLVEFLIEAPKQTIEQVVETGRALDLELRATCHDFIANVAPSAILAPELRDFLAQAAQVVKMAQKDAGVRLATQPFASVQNLKNVSSTAYRKLKDQWPNLIGKLSLYLANQETEGVFTSHIRRHVTDQWNQLRQLVVANYGPEDQLVISVPTPELMNVLLLGSFPVRKQSNVQQQKQQQQVVQPPPQLKQSEEQLAAVQEQDGRPQLQSQQLLQPLDEQPFLPHQQQMQSEVQFVPQEQPEEQNVPHGTVADE